MTALYFFRERNMSIFAQKDINFVPLAVRLSGHFEGSADDVTPIRPPARHIKSSVSLPSKLPGLKRGSNSRRANICQRRSEKEREGMINL